MSAERERIQLALGDIIRDAALRDRLAAAPAETLTELGIEPEDREGMLAAGVERLLAYHHMVHLRQFRTIRSFIGSAARLLGDERLEAEVHEWIAERGSTSPYLREVPGEFLAWARPRWETDETLPPWLAELAAHQVELHAIRNDPRQSGQPNDIGLDLDRPVRCNGTTRLLRYRWAVHTLPARVGPSSPPPAITDGHAVIGYRHGDDGEPRFVDIKARSAHMLERLLAGATLREALFGACEVMGETLDDKILSVTAVTLADLADRQVLLGGVP